MPPSRSFVRPLVLVAAILCVPRAALCQPSIDTSPTEQTPSVAPTAPLTAGAYVPLIAPQRIDWIVHATVGPRSLFVVGPLSTTWQLALDQPEEWGRGGSGIAKRYAERMADVAMSNVIEAELGALWGEDPRYVRSGRKGFWPRTRYVLKTIVLAQRRDGSLKPAWSRYAANTVNNVIENSWLPPSQTTGGQTALRSGLGLLSYGAGNAFEEFWPDLVRVFRR